MKKYRCTFLLGLENALEYRFDFCISLFSTIFPIIIQTFLWTAIYSGEGSRVDNGYTYVQIIMYTFLAGFISKLVSTGFEYEVNEDIKNGGLNKYITRPIGYLGYRFSAFWGGKVPSAAILSLVIGAVLVFSYLFLKAPFQAARILFFILALVLATILKFVLYFSISMLGFWMTEISRFFGTIDILIMIASGGIFPLDIFGSTLKQLSHILPFSYTTQFCVDIINGKLEYIQFAEGFFFQIFWIFIFWITSVILWKKGLKKYVAVGG